jgi:hypothetical protein
VRTINNKVITKVYSRSRVRTKRSKTDDTNKSPFGEIAPDYDLQKSEQKKEKGASLKRKPTPVSEHNLKRSKCRLVLNDGFKPSSPVCTRNIDPVQTRAASIPPSGKNYSFPLP